MPPRPKQGARDEDAVQIGRIGDTSASARRLHATTRLLEGEATTQHTHRGHLPKLEPRARDAWRTPATKETTTTAALAHAQAARNFRACPIHGGAYRSKVPTGEN